MVNFDPTTIAFILPRQTCRARALWVATRLQGQWTLSVRVGKEASFEPPMRLVHACEAVLSLIDLGLPCPLTHLPVRQPQSFSGAGLRQQDQSRDGTVQC